ncbi:hypothetical protein ACA910_007093 [Epithemia clementina (nom. ined.)]
MSKESRKEPTSESSEHQEKSESTATKAQVGQHLSVPSTPQTTSHQFPSSLQPSRLDDDPSPQNVEERKAAPKRDLPSEVGPQSADEAETQPRQVIAVSASKGPAAFFNLARKFLVTDEMCDLSALEGAIVSAVDAAHLLERSKLANIIRIQTSYVTVEPKRRKQAPGTQGTTVAAPSTSHAFQGTSSSGSPQDVQTRRTSSGRELRRARIVITVRRTHSYKKWLEENPLQAIIAGDVEDDSAVEHSMEAEHD